MIGDVEPQYISYLLVNQTRFIEAFISVDDGIVRIFYFFLLLVTFSFRNLVCGQL